MSLQLIYFSWVLARHLNNFVAVFNLRVVYLKPFPILLQLNVKLSNLILKVYILIPHPFSVYYFGIQNSIDFLQLLRVTLQLLWIGDSILLLKLLLIAI